MFITNSARSEYENFVDSWEILVLYIGETVPKHKIIYVARDGLCILDAFKKCVGKARGDEISLPDIKQKLKREMSDAFYKRVFTEIRVKRQVGQVLLTLSHHAKMMYAICFWLYKSRFTNAICGNAELLTYRISRKVLIQGLLCYKLISAYWCNCLKNNSVLDKSVLSKSSRTEDQVMYFNDIFLTVAAKCFAKWLPLVSHLRS